MAVIPARGGSKGIHRKNLVPVAGRPLIAWSIDAALRSRLVDRVVVSTDDEETAAVAIDCGAEVPFVRPAELARDDTPDLPVFRHLLAALPAAELPDVLVHLRATSPMRPDGLIDSAIEMLVAEPGAESVRSVSPVQKSPFKMWFVEGGLLEPVCGSWEEELFNEPRQSLPEVWQHDGVIDVVRRSTIESGSMCGRRILAFRTPAGIAVDIDEPADLTAAAELLEAFRRSVSEDDSGG